MDSSVVDLANGAARLSPEPAVFPAFGTPISLGCPQTPLYAVHSPE